MAYNPAKYKGKAKVYKLKGYNRYLNSYIDWHKELTNYIPDPGLDSWLYFKEWPDEWPERRTDGEEEGKS